MARLTLTNNTAARLWIPPLYAHVEANGSLVVDRFLPDLETIEYLNTLRIASVISMTVAVQDWELEWREFLATQGRAYALHDATRILHEPTVTAADATSQPGLGPTPAVFGALFTQTFTLDSDTAYRIIKIPTNFVGSASFHVHWTKSSDVDESGKVVRWRISYTVIDGRSQDGAGAPTVLEFEDTYEDSGTTTRIVYRTDNLDAIGLTADYYLSVCVEAITPVGTPMVSEPALISVDLLYEGIVNQGD